MSRPGSTSLPARSPAARLATRRSVALCTLSAIALFSPVSTETCWTGGEDWTGESELFFICNIYAQQQGSGLTLSILRKSQAALVAPRPVAGSVRPVVHGSTLKYNSKVRIGRGFSMAEIKVTPFTR